MDRLEAMRVFVAVAESGGFARAARRLSMSPPAVTRAVAAIEERVGAKLLARTTRVVKLTDAGGQYLVDCKRILGEVDEAEARAGEGQVGLRGSLTVTAPVMFGERFVAPILLDFLALNPAVTARALLMDRVVDLLDEGIDVAIRIASLGEQSSDYALRVGAVRRVVCASPAYFAEHGMPRVPADLEKHRAIVYSQSEVPLDWRFEVAPKVESIRPRSALVVNSTAITVAAAVAGRGLTLALSYQVKREVERGELLIALEGFEPAPIPVHVVYRDGPRASARVRAFARFAAERLKREGSFDAQKKRRR